ncbi:MULTISPECIES: restriction endonuclease subunit R [Cyanophyceae]|uniref:restriction endonuclease subunit R n=1 Tax=Cyanophyceae TaxID=3028117 RepID=UPI0016878FB5|nr:restriction endonuclease subunit R [Trichocoleus sp. FACHB-40]MBD2004034.1 restriction endonuclease subunit R [Trichocoleus sp. FACHB-40]
MTANLDAKSLTLRDVHRLLKIEEHFNASIPSLLTLEPLTEFEQQEIIQIRNLFRDYYAEGKISEGQVKFLFVARLMWLAGFYQPSIKITLEEGIADISIEDEETIIKGRMDILAINKTQTTTDTLFWILMIEAKNSSVNAMEGLPQLLTYAYKSLEYQESVWGLTTNGMDYRFAYLQQGISPSYQLLLALNLIDSEPSIQLLQVLKAICKLQNIATPVEVVS